jgi:NAD(P)-dependent dehydrogenase (short-subunit alcohol dehydrogenase family)
VSLTVCDITKPEAVKAWVAGVSEALGDTGLNLLISNAGILTPGPLEVLSLDAVRREFEVNVFGGLSVINAFLPTLRKARGRIVQIGAMTGRFPLPFNGPSSASKAALEAFADVYRGELKPFGVDFVLAQAGNMRTGGPAKTAAALKRVADNFTDEQRRLYGKAFENFTAALNKGQASGLDSAASAKRIVELAEQVPAPARAPVGQDAEEILRAVHEKSDAELDVIRLHMLGLDQN